MTKEIKKEYPDINYKYQLSLCMKHIIEEERLNRPIDFKEFFDFYENNPKLFTYLFYKENILSKNGFKTKSQEYEQEITTSTYKIDNDDIEDIKQEIILRIMQYFQKYKTIKYRYIGNLYRQIAYNSCRSYSRQKKYFHVNKNPNAAIDTSYNSIYNNNELNIEIKDAINKLDPTDQKIVDLLFQGYQKIEIAPMIRKSRQTVYNHIAKIQKAIKIDLACN